MRNLIVSRLTIFNARRGGEPARLTVKEWNDAVNNVWIDQQQVQQIDDPLERAMLPGEDRSKFYRHMGHSEEINKNVYQCPHAPGEIINVGSYLQRFDKATTNTSLSSGTVIQTVQQDTSVFDSSNTFCKFYSSRNQAFNDGCRNSWVVCGRQEFCVQKVTLHFVHISAQGFQRCI
ncbi:histone-lysine N-methyltransferase setd8-a [Plakobranchus ocellatus]|uniref:Histone-lysine N-methyltransferase setd8-a n=1 Tax=Plakobranchus ocellatus TaxID=259542 RepID=A0AAV4DAS0_9GAST|nr:histone-lysine N-methyltransferase setd8-a [Plakobranchus ocellatus]